MMLLNLPTLPSPSVLLQINPLACGLVIILSTPLEKNTNSNSVLCAEPGVLLTSALTLLAVLFLSLPFLTNWRTFIIYIITIIYFIYLYKYVYIIYNYLYIIYIAVIYSRFTISLSVCFQGLTLHHFLSLFLDILISQVLTFQVILTWRFETCGCFVYHSGKGNMFK